MNYTIAKLSDDGTWDALESFETYSEADMNLDWYCDRYPNAYIDIVTSISEHTAVVLG